MRRARPHTPRGFSLVSLALWVAAIGGGYWLLVFGPVYWDNQEVRGILRHAANVAYGQPVDAEVRKFIVDQLTAKFGREVEHFGQRRLELVMEFEPDELVLRRTESPPHIDIDFDYRRTVELPLVGGQRVLHFHVHAAQDLSVVKW